MMIKHTQTECDKGRGNCHQTAIASLLELEICQVPHFRLFDEDTWWPVLCGFVYALGYDMMGTGWPKDTIEGTRKRLANSPAVNGCIEACVPSKTYPPEEDITHAVLIDNTGLVVHDPHPTKKWEGLNPLETGELRYWALIEKRDQP
jgi:hypothetical protein